MSDHARRYLNARRVGLAQLRPRLAAVSDAAAEREKLEAELAIVRAEEAALPDVPEETPLPGPLERALVVALGGLFAMMAFGLPDQLGLGALGALGAAALLGKLDLGVHRATVAQRGVERRPPSLVPLLVTTAVAALVGAALGALVGGSLGVPLRAAAGALAVGLSAWMMLWKAHQLRKAWFERARILSERRRRATQRERLDRDIERFEEERETRFDAVGEAKADRLAVLLPEDDDDGGWTH